MSTSPKKFKGNKGEWSEVYAFLKILSDGKIFSADKNLEVIKGQFYSILKVVRGESKTKEKIYDLTERKGNVCVLDANEKLLTVVPVGNITGKLGTIFKRIRSQSVASFFVPEASELMTRLLCSGMKSSNVKKADIVLIIHDHITNFNSTVGFSIKSYAGAASTLLNASGATNFIYRIDNARIDKNAVNSIDTRSKIRDRIQHIYENGGAIRYLNVSSRVFEKNLRKVDSFLPNILAEIIVLFYLGKGNTIKELAENLSIDTLVEYAKYDLDHDDMVFKLKNLLLYIALGMFPNKKWDGLLKAYGGYIIVKEDGDIVCYHMYNLDEFRDYLFENTRLDTPSSSRHGFGSIYESNGYQFVDLNLQIRFIR